MIVLPRSRNLSDSPGRTKEYIRREIAECYFSISAMNRLMEEYGEAFDSEIVNEVLEAGARRGDIDVVQFAMSHGADIHHGRDMALRLASEKNHLIVMRYLLEFGASPFMISPYANSIAFAIAREFADRAKEAKADSDDAGPDDE